MSEEEKQAIFRMRELEDDKEHLVIEQRQAVTTVLNLIDKQQKVIDKMAEELDVSGQYKEEIKEYFYKEIENE